MTGIWLLLWIIYVSFMFGLGFERWLECTKGTPGRFKVKLNMQTFLNPMTFLVPGVIINTMDHVVKSGWLPKSAALHWFQQIGDGLMAIWAVLYLTLAIAYIIKNRTDGRRSGKVAVPGPH